MLTAEQIKQALSTEDIISLCLYLQGDDVYLYDAQGHPIFNTCLDHETGSSFKLYYYEETKMFKCYTSGESYDIFGLVERFLKLDFREALEYIVKFFHLNSFNDFSETKQLTDDWDIFQSIKDNKPSENSVELTKIQENTLEYFLKGYPSEWIKEGISCSVMDKYEIRVDTCLQKVIIPQRDVDGNLVGIRGRTYDPIEINNGKKYMPVNIQGDWYNCPSGQILYGLYQNKDTIKKLRKIIIFESEKSVLQMATFNGIDNCVGVATSGSSLSKEQIKMIIDLGITEVVLAYDREFLGNKADKDTIEYERKLLKIIQPLTPYMDAYIIMDYDHLTNYKDSPTDRGKEIFDKLYKNKIRIKSINENDIWR